METNRIIAGKYFNQLHANRKDLGPTDLKKVLELFVENDEALGQLLDFISSHYMKE